MTDETKSLDVVNFTNVDNHDFQGMWGGETTLIKAGETRQFPKFLAEHYCKHLVDRILLRSGLVWTDAALRKPYEEKILGKVVVEIEKLEIKEKAPEEPKETPKEFEGIPKEETKPAPKRRGRKPKVV
jgi:hypothetical protein